LPLTATRLTLECPKPIPALTVCFAEREPAKVKMELLQSLPGGTLAITLSFHNTFIVLVEAVEPGAYVLSASVLNVW
jgi:hypothetical protein